MNNALSLVINGQSILGNITQISHSDISVEITAPFAGYTNSRHLPTFARASNNLLENSDATAAELLTELYKDLTALTVKSEQLSAGIFTQDGLLGTVHQNGLDQSQLVEQKQTLKKQFQAQNQELSQKDYQSRLKSLGKQALQLELATSTAIDQFIDAHLPQWHYALDHDQIISFLSSASQSESQQ